MTEITQEDLFQQVQNWLELVGVEFAAVHVALDTGDRFVVLYSSMVEEVEESIPNFFSNCTMKVMGHDIDSGEAIYHVVLPVEYQGVI